MCRERSGHKFFEKAAKRAALRTHAPLFGNHVALFVKLAENGMKETLRVEVGPQLEAIDWQRVEVDRLIGSGERVHADAARLIDDLRELVRHDVLLRNIHGVFP